MLVARGHVDPDLLDPFEASRDGYAALSAGIVATLAHEGSSLYPELITRSIARLLLETPSSAIMHFEPAVPSDNLSLEPSSEGVMMAANYHNGHSEGYHRIILQDPDKPEEGQWLLWIPPESGNRTFYRRAFCRGSDAVYEFERAPANPEKISNYFMHAGAPSEAIQAFRDCGFTFDDRVLGADYDDPEYERLRTLSNHTRSQWDPLDISQLP